MISDWDDAYANAPHIPDGESYVARWEARAGAFRTAMAARMRPIGDLAQPRAHRRAEGARPRLPARDIAVAAGNMRRVGIGVIPVGDHQNALNVSVVRLRSMCGMSRILALM